MRGSKEHRDRSTGNTEIQEIQLKHDMKFIVRVVKRWNGLLRGCAVSILGDPQNPTGRGSGQPAPADPAWRRGAGRDDLPAIFLFSPKLLTDSSCHLLRRSAHFSKQVLEMHALRGNSQIRQDFTLLGENLPLKKNKSGYKVLLDLLLMIASNGAVMNSKPRSDPLGKSQNF